MQIYEYHPIYFVRLSITQQNKQTEYLSLIDTTPEEVKSVLTNLIESQHISPFEKHKTSINIREAWGAKNGKSTSISFRGLDPQQTVKLIKGHIQKHNGK